MQSDDQKDPTRTGNMPEGGESEKGPVGYTGDVDAPYVDSVEDRPPGDQPEYDTPIATSPEEVAMLKEKQRVEDLISKAQKIYHSSTRYIEANITTAWERNLAHFNSEHAPGSRINSRNYKRSRTFRPKTRSSTKAAEAALTTAAFSTLDLVDVEAEDPRDERQTISAAINKAMLQYRLDRRMPWYLTAIGAYQCTKVYGLCISHQYWQYKTEQQIVPALDEQGQLVIQDGVPMGKRERKVLKDDLCSDLVAPENFRFDAMCDWRDPVGTSPYLVYIMPIYAEEALTRMKTDDPKTGQKQWKNYSIDTLLATRRKLYDRTRQAREGDRRIDPANEYVTEEFTMLMAHMNIIRMNGVDMMYWTMGTELLLTDPVPLAEAYPHLDSGERPFTMGFSSIEAFRNYPAGDIEQGAGLQTEVNEVANQRLDNVKLVLNKRYYVRRGSQVDLDALIRNVPGGGVMMNDPEKDVKTVETHDVTSSSYQEQDRLMMEYDDLVGNFSQATQGNKQSKGADNTKGGQAQMGLSANAMSDYSMRIFLETWMEKTLRQLVKLIQYYETDLTIITLAAKKSDLWLRYGIDKPSDELIRKDLVVRINVGMGNTDPMRKVERLLLGVSKILEVPGMKSRVKPSPIADDVFGALGYKSSARFFRTDEEQEKHLEENPPEPPMEMKLKQQELAIRREDNKARDKKQMMELQLKRELGYAELALRDNISLREVEAKLGISVRADGTQRDIADQTDIRTRELGDQSDRTKRDSAAASEVGKRVTAIESARQSAAASTGSG